MKKFAILLAIVTLLLALVACKPSTGVKNYSEHAGLLEIVGRRNLYYDANTRVVYILFNECSGYTGYGYMSAYYAPNGLPYLYDINTGALVEITP